MDILELDHHFSYNFIPEKVNTYWRPVTMEKIPGARMRPTKT